MAFVVPTRKGSYEIRESSNTDKGPRSRTLVSFRELTDEVIEKARKKAVKPPSAEELRRAARRAGAPVARAPIEQAARELIAELAKRRPARSHPAPDPARTAAKGIPRDADASPASEAARAVALWMAATPESGAVPWSTCSCSPTRSRPEDAVASRCAFRASTRLAEVTRDRRSADEPQSSTNSRAFPRRSSSSTKRLPNAKFRMRSGGRSRSPTTPIPEQRSTSTSTSSSQRSAGRR